MRQLPIILALLVASTSPAEAAGPLPKVAEGWRIEVVAQAPEIAFPTAVVAAPDGTAYLGQDPMDMPGPANSPTDSIVTLKDGKVRTYAEKLWAVMGLEWVDGTLYVVHPPFLSALRDADGDGKAESRVDLITGLGPKLPAFNGINDHIASGVRLGMDGFLYISVGDKGIQKGVGKDGATITLHGGGVIRVRPDGSGLEVVSTGERNPLSVALTAADDVFTYGNDDDSRKWPNSLTHHIVGGHYGYPYQFLDHPDRCLPVVAGQVGGSGTQGVCYDEDGLPERFKGNLFFTDWGLQQVDRFVVEPAGASFRLVSREPIVTKGDLADFRPFSLCVTPDGAGFYLVDWAFSGWLADVGKTGRLYRLTYTGADKPRPADRPQRGNPSSTLAELDHPARSIRAQAQRDLGVLKVGGLAEALAIPDGEGGPAGFRRRHIFWALLDQALAKAGPKAELLKAVATAPNEKDPALRAQFARGLGILRDPSARDGLVTLLTDPEPIVRREAAIALGRTFEPPKGLRAKVVVDPSKSSAAAAALMVALGDPDLVVDWSVRHALKTIGVWDSRALVAALLDPKRRDSALKLADETWARPVAEALKPALKETRDAPTRARIVTVLAGLYRQYPPWNGQWFGTNPLVGEAPRKTVDWDKEAQGVVLAGLASGLEDDDKQVRARAIAGLAAAGEAAAPRLVAALDKEQDGDNLVAIAHGLGLAKKSPQAMIALAALAQDSKRPVPIRAAAVDGLASFRGPISLKARFALAFDPQAPASLVAKILPPLSRIGALPPSDLASFLDRPEPAVRASALQTFAGLKEVTPFVAERIVARLDDPDPDARKSAIAAVAGLKLADAVPKLLELARDEAIRTEATLALCALRDPRAVPAYLSAIQDRNPDLRRGGEVAIAAIRDKVGPALEGKARDGSLGGVATELLDRALTRYRPIVDWKVIGPFPHAIPRVFFGEKAIDFGRIYAGLEDRPVAWTPAQGDPETGKVVLDDPKTEAGEKGAFGYDTSADLGAFAFAEFTSEADRPATLSFGSSGSLIVTLNEEFILNANHSAGRLFAPDSERVAVRLKAGVNRLLVFNRQGVGAWSFGVRVSEPSTLSPSSGPKGFSPEAYRVFAMEHAGDPKHGEAIFFDAKGIGCVKCHSASGQGTADVGPDLTGLALKYDKSEVIRSVLEPSARMAIGYQPVIVATTDGRVLAGLVRSEAEAHLDLVDADGKVTRLAKADIDERHLGDTSLMPANLVEALAPQEFADLIAYLQSLKITPPAPAAR